MKILSEKYEYAGFIYSIEQDDGGRIWARTVEGQHPAANKQKHRTNAMMCYLADNA